MGGVAGHMSHLYDNRDLTFQKMKEILEAASAGNLEAEEKVDGQNLFLSYSVEDGEAKAARNKGNLKDGGMNKTELSQKFAGRGALADAFNEGFGTFEKAVQSLSDKEKVAIFGPDANIWFNAEIMDPRSPNVINYDSQVLKIHDAGHFEFDRETGDKSYENVSRSLEILDSRLDQLQQNIDDSNFGFVRRAVINLEQLDNEVPLKRAVSQINSAIHAERLNDDSTIGEYLYNRLMNGLDTDLSKELREEITKYLLNLPGKLNLRVIKKGLSKENLQDLVAIVDNKRAILQQAILPIERAVHDFTVEILKGLESRFVIDSGAEVNRLQKELSKAVNSITEKGADDPESMEIMQQHLNKIGEMTNINTPIEGIVFDYDGHTYKFTGNFAPLNQILGMFKYGRGKKVQESVSRIIEREEKISSEPSKAERFVLSLPKFTPTEAWGDPNSMEREQIQRIFDTVGGGATIQEKLKFLNDSIENPKGGIRSPRRIISTLILLESIRAVIESFGEAPAGFVFEGFMAGLLRGKQVAGRTEKGNLPIQDLIAFSELDGGKSVPVSLKLLKGLAPGKKGTVTPIEGSYTNLVDALEEFGMMVYIVGRKDGEKIVLEKFTFTRDNFIDALITGGKGGLVKEADLFLLPDMDRKESLDLIRSINDWPTLYELLQLTAGYDPKERARKLSDKEKEEKVAITDEVPDGEDIQPDTEPANKKEYQYSVAECRKMWEDLQLLNESLLIESSQRQWSISPAQLNQIAPMVDYETLGSLPYKSDKIVKVAEQYMKYLSDNLLNVFEATKNLSENITEYFTFRKRSKAISSGEKAIQDSNTIGNEMTQQLSQDQGVKESLIIERKNGRRIALFPGKFKPPHRGHLEYISNIANRSDVDEVLIMISPRDLPEVSKDQSLAIWHKYLEKAPNNIGVEISDYRSPVTATYEFLADPTMTEPGDVVLMVKSSKDEKKGDSRFDAIKSWAASKNPDISVDEIVEDPVVDADDVAFSAENIRKTISSNNKEEFARYIPDSVDVDEIWNIVKPTAELDLEIEAVVDEISTMSSGAVVGPGGPLMTPVRRSKTASVSKPKVKKAKRQRRR